MKLSEKFEALMRVCDPCGDNSNDPELEQFEEDVLKDLKEYENI